MREILYKAKRNNWHELQKEVWWVEGYPVKIQPCASKDEYIYGIVPKDASALYIAEIDPETICQYTGLNDKHGKKIWEHDIARIKSSVLSGYGEICYENGCLILKDKKRKRTYNMFGKWKTRVDGNIFDNPELIKEE